MSPSVHLWPTFEGPDEGDGGVRRVIENQIRHLPAHGWSIEPVVQQADVIAAHIDAPNPYLNLYPRTPLVAHIHGLYWSEFEWDNWAIKANSLVMELIRVADLITVPTEWVAQAVRRHTMRRPIVIPHGINLDEWKVWEPTGQGEQCPEAYIDFGDMKIRTHLPGCEGENPGGYVLWNKTRPDPVCDPHAVGMLAMLMPDVQFRATFGDAMPNVQITGRLSYEAAKVDVERAGCYLCTTRETFGIGTLEALAAGVPVVGWRWGGQAEFITQGVDGYLALPGDYDDLVKGVRWALEARKTDETRAACRLKAGQFPWQRAAAMYAAVYDEALATKRKYGGSGDAPRSAPTDPPLPKVSVIVTAYKLDEYLRGCLDSVAAQTLTEWECIIVDDASPDTCGAIADEFAATDPRFKVVHNKKNLYLAGARNVGIAASRGEYILPVDADDELAPAALETLAAALDHDRRIHIAYGNVQFLEVGGERDGQRWMSGWPIDFDITLQWKGPGQLGPYSSMFRREVLELTGGYRTRCRSSEDCDVWLRASSYGFRPRMVTNETCLIYRNRADSMSHTEGWQEHRQWYPWVKNRALAPAGALVVPQLPVHSCDPPLVSVIIPVGPGHEQYVIDAVDSVDAQTFRLWECIVINDTGALLPTLPSWVKVIHPVPIAGIDDDQPRGACRFGGVATARNAGIRASKGRYFLPLDADDILEPRCLELMVMVAQDTGEEPDPHHAYGPIVYSDFFEDPAEQGKFAVYRCPSWDPKLLIQSGTVSAVTQLTPKAVWEKVGGYDETLLAWEDWAFQIDCAALGYCSKRIPLALWTYRKHTGFRRNENASQTDAGKAGIIKKYDGKYWDLPGKPKREELMACRTCGGSGVASPPTTFNRAAPPPEGAQLVEYIGAQRGAAKTIKTRTDEGGSGTTYRFDPEDGPFYVLSQDVERFTARPTEYRVVASPVEAPVEPETPLLATDAREPVKVRAPRKKAVTA